MNLTARVKNTKYKPNYILNVNINIPITPSQLVSDRPVSGQFTFSPSQLKKKLKLQIPSVRTTYQCESRKISYLGDTLNTISHRITGKKALAKSAQPSVLTSQIRNASKKSKNEYRSQAASPVRKKMGNKLNKTTKLVLSNNNISRKQLICSLLNESQDSIMGYTNQSMQLAKGGKAQNPTKQGNDKICHKISLKSQSPILQQQNLLQQIREYEKSAQDRKQYLNYIYLKQKILMLASVKKIQRAWRNYITKKLIKSYSNKKILQLSSTLKNILFHGQKQQNKILTLKSSILSKNYHHSQIKKNQFVTYNQIINKYGIKQSIKSQDNHIQSLEKYTIQKERQNNVKSVNIQCQLQEIIRYDRKNVDEIPTTSVKKQKIEKQFFNHSNQINAQQRNIQKISDENNRNKQTSNQSGKIGNNLNFGEYCTSLSSQNSFYEKLNLAQPSKILNHQIYLQQQNSCSKKFQDDESEDGFNTQRRKRKLQFFQSQIRKIDNQESLSNISQSNSSEVEVGQNSPITKCINLERDAQQQENMKLKRKLEAISRTQLLESESMKIKNEFDVSDKKESPEKINENQQSKVRQLNSNKQIQAFEKNCNLPRVPGEKNLIKDSIGQFNFKKSLQDFKRFVNQEKNINKYNQIQVTKYDTKQLEVICEKLQQDLIDDIVMDLSKKEGFISKMEAMYTIKNNSKVLTEENKAEGICTNLESIKDYLQNFVAFAFEQQPTKVLYGFNYPNEPNTIQILKLLNKKEGTNSQSFKVPVLSLQLFNTHWQHATQQIYFDVKYIDDPVEEQKRVTHLKSITQTYFRAIFDGFNQCLQPFRRYGRGALPFPWSKRTIANRAPLTLDDIKPLVRLGYKKLAQISTLYCGMLIQDRVNMSSKIEQIEHNRLSALLEIELHDDEIKWYILEREQTEVLWQMSRIVQQILILEMCNLLQLLNCSP